MISIVDYGMGNLHSIVKALHRINVETNIIHEPNQILKAKKIILPGVGHFKNGMDRLNDLGFLEPLNQKALKEKIPVLGICLGAQLLTDFSEEGKCSGLGWIPGRTIRFRFDSPGKLKVPHIGWNQVSIGKQNDWSDGFHPTDFYYFVHSYFIRCEKDENIAGITRYGLEFHSVIQNENIIGMQFHPEKSHAAGLKLLRFLLPVKLTTSPVFRPRVIPVLLLRNQGLVKTIRFKNPTYIGDPINAVKIFNELESDELIFLDIMADRENRSISPDMVRKIGHEAFMPFSVGGGIRSVQQIADLIRAGAEKVVINTAAILQPELVSEGVARCGSQSILISIDMKRNVLGKSKVWIKGGTVQTSVDPVEHAKAMTKAGAGEILINSIDLDGTLNGYDLGLIRELSKAVSVPVIACGGAGNFHHFEQAIEAGAHAVAAGSMFVFHGARRAVLINYPDKKDLQTLVEKT